MTISTDYRDEAFIRIARGLLEIRPDEQTLRALLETSAIKPNDGDVGREVQHILYALIARDHSPGS